MEQHRASKSWQNIALEKGLLQSTVWLSDFFNRLVIHRLTFPFSSFTTQKRPCFCNRFENQEKLSLQNLDTLLQIASPLIQLGLFRPKYVL